MGTNDLGLGKIIAGNALRDAIHVAVAPVKAKEKLWPGQHVALVDGWAGIASSRFKSVGIVDPFLTGPVFAEQSFWLFLYPNTVTGMRHHWSHPDFDGASISSRDPEGDSRRWMEDFAKKHYEYTNYPDTDDRHQFTADELIEAAKDYLKTGHRRVQQGSESLRDDTPSTEFWHHFQIITKINVPLDTLGTAPFCCTC
jgi:hypothetical protein